MRALHLPRSLDPLPQESLPGFVLRLAHRLERTPGRIAWLTGLAPPTRMGSEQVPASMMLYLDPHVATRFARATRLTRAEVADLCMNRYSARYLPLDFAGPDPRRAASDAARRSAWVSTTSTRYCPQCLAGNGERIQQDHGGSWQQTWRLPIIVACLVHKEILRYRCPSCEQPIHSTTAALLPRLGDTGLHPAQCRSTVRPQGRWAPQSPACGTRLDISATLGSHLTPDSLSRVLDQQRQLLAALRPDGGVSETAARDLTGDLIAVAILIKMSWPSGQDLVFADLRATIGNDAEHARQAVRHKPPSHAGTLRSLRQPPADPLACAGLMVAADLILSRESRDLRDAIAPMLAYLSACEPGALYLLRSRTACSAALHAAMRSQRGGFYRASRTLSRPGAPPARLFLPQHVPAFLPHGLYDRHMGDLGGISAKLLRRAACFKLFELANGGTWADAAECFQIPPSTARSTLTFVRRWTTQNLSLFEDAVESIAREMESSTDLADYQSRRRVMANWAIPPADWQALVLELTATRPPGRLAVYDDRKRLIASVLVWAEITQGEHLFAPLVLAEKQRHGSSGLSAAVSDNLRGRTPKNAALMDALAVYAGRLPLTPDAPQIWA